MWATPGQLHLSLGRKRQLIMTLGDRERPKSVRAGEGDEADIGKGVYLTPGSAHCVESSRKKVYRHGDEDFAVGEKRKTTSPRLQGCGFDRNQTGELKQHDRGRERGNRSGKKRQERALMVPEAVADLRQGRQASVDGHSDPTWKRERKERKSSRAVGNLTWSEDGNHWESPRRKKAASGLHNSEAEMRSAT